MDLKKKIEMLNLSEREQEVLESGRFMLTLKLISIEELKEELDFLASKGVNITKAKNVRVLAEPVANLVNKFSLLSQSHEEEIFIKDPSFLEKNALQISSNIDICKRVGKVYRKEDGSYEHFLIDKLTFQKEMNKNSEMDIYSTFQPVEEEITLETITNINDDKIVNFSDYSKNEEPVMNDSSYVEPFENDFEKTIRLELDETLSDTIHQDVTTFKDDSQKLEEQIISFEEQKKQLNDLKAQLNDEVNFMDLINSQIESESYGMGRVA